MLHAAKLPGDVWNERVCSRAAQHPDSIPVLQWLRAQQPPIPWDASVCTSAVRQVKLGRNKHYATVASSAAASMPNQQ